MKNAKKKQLLGIKSLLTFVLIFMTTFVVAQTKNVTGVVIDELGDPLIGVTVSIQGTTMGTITDLDGAFSIQAKSGDVLVVTMIGYADQTVKVGSQTHVNITLSEDTQLLDEVVVVGYGVQKKSDITGSIASVSAKDLTTQPVNNAFEALQGKAAGVDITTSERPGTLGSIRIRGTRSITAEKGPLYVVDGIPLMSSSNIETLNPRDIESIDILKDASATAIYGSRGANGVIIVTTKQGKTGRFTLDYSGTLTVSNIVDRAKSMSASEFVDFRRWAAYNLDPKIYAHPNSPTMENDKLIFDSALDMQTSRDNVLLGWAGGNWDSSRMRNTDWTDFVTQTGFSHEHTLSASGGSEKMNAYGSFGYLKNEGTQKGQEYERYTFKLSTNIDPTPWFTLSGSMNVSWSKQDYGMSTLGGRSGSVPDAIYGAAKSIYNFAVPYDEDGNLIINPGGENSIYTIMNEWDKSTQRSQTLRALGSFHASLKFGKILSELEGLTYKFSFGPDFRHRREGVYIDGSSAHKINSNGTDGKNFARLRTNRDFSWTLDNLITYDRTIAEKHKIGVTLLQTASKWDVENSSMSAENIEKPSYLWNAFGTVDLTNKDNNAAMSSGITKRQLTSYMARLNYGFNERYLLTVSGRWDGASQLADGHKWDFFPSAALAWRANDELFLKDISWLSNLKMRLGVGVTGNAAVDPYVTKGDITSIYLPFNGMDNLIGYTTNEPYYMKDQLSMANPLLGWEKTTQYNLGVDFGVFRGRISGTLDFYMSKTKDLLLNMNIPTLTGFPSMIANIGETSNRGVELTLNVIPVQTKDFVWESSFNAAWQKNKIDLLAYGTSDMPDNAWFIGQSINVFYGYKHDGLWQDTPEDHAEMAKWNANGESFSPGSVRPKDTNGDYKMDAKDRVVIGNKDPRWVMGWHNSFNYKGIDLGVSLYGRMGYTVNTGGQALTAHSNQMKIDYWTPDNTNAEFQKPVLAQATSGSKDNYSGLLGFKDASFVKVRNISLGYNIPKNICTKAGVSNLKVYAQVINPFSIYQSISWYDLDVNATNFNRSFVFGLNLGF